MELSELRTFEDLGRLAPPLLQQTLAKVPDALLAQVFQGLDVEVAKAIFANLSDRRRALVLIERQRVGRLTEDAVLAARANVLKHARGLTGLASPPPAGAPPETPVAPPEPSLPPEQRKEIQKRQWARAITRLQETNPELRRLAEERQAIVLAAFLKGTIRGEEPKPGKPPSRAD